MSSASDKATARRAKILARGKERMATVSGATVISHTEEDVAANDATAAPIHDVAHDVALSTIDADAALDAALNEMNTSVPAPSGSTSTPDDIIELDTSTVHTSDPHEFPSSDEVHTMSQLSSPYPIVGTHPSEPADPFQVFARVAQQTMQHQQQTGTSGSFAHSAAALRRRNKDAAAAAALTQELDLPKRSGLQRLAARVRNEMNDTSKVRTGTTMATLLVAILSGIGYIEGGLGWLLLVELFVLSVTFIYSSIIDRIPRNMATAAAARRPAPSPPPVDVAENTDEYELDTDQYKSAPMSQMQGIPDLSALLGGGKGGLSALGLPPALDTGIKALSLLLKYASFMRQLLNDAMIFIFVTVITNALVQLSQPQQDHYVIA
jgi:hypothetical protein